MDWLQVFVNLIVTGILLYVFQRVIDERSEKRLEQFRSELRTLPHEQDTKFSKLHEVRSDVIANLYKRLVEVRKKLISLKNVLSSKEFEQSECKKKISDFYLATNQFIDYFGDNEIYLPKHLVDDITQLRAKSLQVRAIGILTLDPRYPSELSTPIYHSEEERKEDLAKISEILLGVDPLISKLAEEFRSVIGS